MSDWIRLSPAGWFGASGTGYDLKAPPPDSSGVHVGPFSTDDLEAAAIARFAVGAATPVDIAYLATERAHWYYDVPMALVADIVRTLRD